MILLIHKKKSSSRLLGRLWKLSSNTTHVCEVTWAHVGYYDSFMYVTLLIHKNKLSSRSLDRCWKPSGDMTHSCVWHDLGAFVILRLIHICDITTLLIHQTSRFRDRSIDFKEIWLIHVCVATWAHARDVISSSYVCNITNSQQDLIFDIARQTSKALRWHDIFLCVRWLMRKCVFYESLVYMTSRIHKKKWSSRSLDTLAEPCVDIFMCVTYMRDYACMRHYLCTRSK